MRRILPGFLFMTLLLSACNYQISSPARTEVPIFVAPPLDTPTPQPTPTTDYRASIQLGEEVVVPEEAYAFKPVLVAREGGPVYKVSFLSDSGGNKYTLIDAEDSGLSFSIWNFQDKAIADEQSCLAYAIEKYTAQDGSSTLPVSEPTILPIGTAQLSRLSMNLMGYHSTGELLYLLSGSGCLVFFGMSNNKFEDDFNLWNNIGKPSFDQMAASLHFITPEALPLCQPSPRDSYALLPEDPIAVGNSNLYDGREREELYLLTLRGPNNEEILFERQNPIFNQHGEIVDPYLVRYSNATSPTTLYFTIYRFEEPLYAPKGFSCEAAFPLSDPQP